MNHNSLYCTNASILTSSAAFNKKVHLSKSTLMQYMDGLSEVDKECVIRLTALFDCLKPSMYVTIDDEEDKKFRELIDVRNQADSLIHGSEKTLGELGEKVSSDERLKIENAVSDLKVALEGEDKDAIEAKSKILAEASAEIAQKLYAEQAASSAEGESSEDKEKDDIVDAEFEEVEEEKADK